MGSDKTYIFDGGGTGGGLDIAALVSSMMSNKGMDPNLVAALMNGNNNRGSWGVPMLADIVSKDGLTVATTRDGLKPTIMEAQQMSRDIVESYEKHKANLEIYDSILMQLDPEAARTKELESENRELRRMIADMNERISKIPTAEELRSLVKTEAPAKTK